MKSSLSPHVDEHTGSGYRNLLITADNGYFGITISNESPAVVENVKSGGPADAAGLERGDRIVFVNGNDVTGLSHKAVVEMIKSHAAVTLRVKRSSRPVSNKHEISPTGPTELTRTNSSSNNKAHHPPLPIATNDTDVPDSSSSVFKTVKRWSTFHVPRGDEKKVMKTKKDKRKTTQVAASQISGPVPVDLQLQTQQTKLATLKEMYSLAMSQSSGISKDAAKHMEEEIAKIEGSRGSSEFFPLQPLTENGAVINSIEDSKSPSDVIVPDDNTTTEQEGIAFESIELAKRLVKSHYGLVPNGVSSPNDTNMSIETLSLVPPVPFRGLTKSLNDLAEAEEPDLASDTSQKNEGDNNRRTIDGSSLLSSSSGIIFVEDSNPTNLFVEGPLVPKHNSTKSKLSVVKSFKKRSNSSDDVHMHGSLANRENLSRKDSSDSQLRPRGDEEVDSLSDEPKPGDETIADSEDYLSSLMNPSPGAPDARPSSIPLAIIGLDDEDDDEALQKVVQSQQQKFQRILPMESPNEDESEDVRRHQSTSGRAADAAFQDASRLVASPGHCIVVLRFMYSRDTHSALLYYLITHKYFHSPVPHPKGADGIKEKLSWAVEIHSTFTGPNAPWPIPEMPEPSRALAEVCFKKDNPNQIETFMKEARLVCERKINEELFFFRESITKGFGEHYGVNLLTETRKNHKVDQLLVKLWMESVEHLRREDGEKSRVLLSALFTVFSYYRCAPLLYEKWFVRLFCEPLRKLKKAETKKIRGHFCSDFVFTTYANNCAYCSKILFGPNYQGVRCDGCNLDFHESCLVHLTTECAKRKPLRVWRGAGKKPSIEHSSLVHHPSFEGERNISPDLAEASNISPQPSIVVSESTGLESALTVSDEELADGEENDPPTCYHRKHPEEIKGREQSRQCAIHELLRIELYHVYKLRILHDHVFWKLVHGPDYAWSEAIRYIFPNLPKLIQEHANFYNMLKERHLKQCPFVQIGDILLDMVSDERYASFMSTIADFLEAQAEYDNKWVKLRADRRFVDVISDIERHPRLLRKRRQVDSLKVAEMQLIARYPLLIDGIIKYSPDDRELNDLKEARVRFVQLADDVNTNVGKAEKRLQKRDLEDNLVIFDKEKLFKHFPFLESPKTMLGELVHCGDLLWKLPNSSVPVRVYLFSTGVVLICVRQGSTLQLKMQTIGIPGQSSNDSSTLVGSTNFHLPQAPVVEFCPVIELGRDTKINMRSQAQVSKDRIDILPPKHEVKLGAGYYRFCFVGTGPKDASSEWDEWTHYLSLIQKGLPITRFKATPRPKSTCHNQQSTSSLTSVTSETLHVPPSVDSSAVFTTPDRNSAVIGESPISQSSSPINPAQSPEPSKLLPPDDDDRQSEQPNRGSSPAFDDAISTDNNEQVDNDENVNDSGGSLSLQPPSESEVTTATTTTTTNNNSFFVGGDSPVESPVPPVDEQTTSTTTLPGSSSASSASSADPLITPELVNVFGFKDTNDLFHVGNFLLQKPLASHSPLARTNSPKFTFPTIGSLMSPSKKPTELHEHLLCLSLEINRLASLALANTTVATTTASNISTTSTSQLPHNTSNGSQPGGGSSRVSFLAEPTSPTPSDPVGQIEQLVTALRRRMEVLVQMSAAKSRQPTVSESDANPIPL